MNSRKARDGSDDTVLDLATIGRRVTARGSVETIEDSLGASKTTPEERIEFLARNCDTILRNVQPLISKVVEDGEIRLTDELLADCR